MLCFQWRSSRDILHSLFSRGTCWSMLSLRLFKEFFSSKKPLSVLESYSTTLRCHDIYQSSKLWISICSENHVRSRLELDSSSHSRRNFRAWYFDRRIFSYTADDERLVQVVRFICKTRTKKRHHCFATGKRILVDFRVNNTEEEIQEHDSSLLQTSLEA